MNNDDSLGQAVTFTGIPPGGWFGEGTLIKGNLRADRAVVWEKVQEGVERLFGSKYEVFMLEEPGFAGGDDDRSSGGGDSDNTSRGPRVSFLLVPGDKAERVARYSKSMRKEVGIIAHSCGVPEPRRLKRFHCRVVQEDCRSVPLNELYPDAR